MLTEPLVIPLTPDSICRVWLAITLVDKAKVSVTFNNQDYALLQKDDVPKEIVYQKFLLYGEGDQLNFQCNKDVNVNRFVIGYTLGSI